MKQIQVTILLLRLLDTETSSPYSELTPQLNKQETGDKKQETKNKLLAFKTFFTVCRSDPPHSPIPLLERRSKRDPEHDGAYPPPAFGET